MNTWEASNLRIRQEIEALKEKDTEEKTLELIDKYIALQDSYQNKVLRVINMKKLDIETEIPSVLVEDIRLNRERMLQVSDLLLGLQEQEMKNELLSISRIL